MRARLCLDCKNCTEMRGLKGLRCASWCVTWRVPGKPGVYMANPPVEKLNKHGRCEFWERRHWWMFGR